jgi:hypothetical protein
MSASPAQLPAPNTDLIANVFDVLPLPAFVVDHDFNIVDFNLAGAKLLDRVPFAVLRLRGGDQVQCIHSIETGDGDATPACQECIVKNFVKEVFDEGKACRKTERMRLTREGKAGRCGLPDHGRADSRRARATGPVDSGRRRGIVHFARIEGTVSLPLLLLLQIPKPARKHPAAKRAIVDAHETVALLAENKIVFRVDLREYSAVGELVGLRVARQFQVHQLVEIGAAGHEDYILSH